MASLPTLEVTAIGDFIRHRSCQRQLKLSFQPQLARTLPFFDSLSSNVIDPVLAEHGRRREREWEEQLQARGFRKLALEDSAQDEEERGLPWARWRDLVLALPSGVPAYAREVSVCGRIGDYLLLGRIDFVLVLWDEHGRPYLRLVECKASRADRTYHRLQAACYRRIVDALLRERPLSVAGAQLDPDSLETCVARIDEVSNRSQDMLAVPALEHSELEVLEDDLERLLCADGLFRRVEASPLEELPYQLDERCSDCFFAVFCFAESARERRLELLGLAASEAQALRAAGIATIDDLAELAPEDGRWEQMRRLGFDPQTLRLRAEVRRARLAGPKAGGRFQVEPLRRSAALSLLPEHGDGAQRLIRIYLAVDRDYVENRLLCLSAHVTRSQGLLECRFRERAGGGWEPDPTLYERSEPAQRKGRVERRALASSGEVIALVEEPWTGDALTDDANERETLRRFLEGLLDTIERLAMGPTAPLHLYVWEESELRFLIESCIRLDDGSHRLLAAVRNLLSQHDHSEQAMHSLLGEELTRRYAVAASGTGPLVAASLPWFGERFHWTRKVGGDRCDLRELFRQDLFDFSAFVRVHADGSWAAPGEGERLELEVRGRYRQSLSVPYVRALWRQLPDPKRQRDDPALARLQPKVREALVRYNDAVRPRALLDAFLKARVQALRWLEERMTPKNAQLRKEPLAVSGLREFSLELSGPAEAAVDFLRLDRHIALSQWTARHLSAPAGRVAAGLSLPLADCVADEADPALVRARLDAERYGTTARELAALASYGEGSFVRLTPSFDDPERAQTCAQLFAAGKSCRIERLNWERGEVELRVLRFQRTPYTLRSFPFAAGDGFAHATLDESPSDLVSGRAEATLRRQPQAEIYGWLDLRAPRLPELAPLAPERRQALAELLAGSFLADPLGGEPRALSEDQREAVLAGLDTRIQLVQGPPGTGKTQTTASAVLARILARGEAGSLVCLVGPTHRAVDELLQRLDGLRDGFARAAAALGLELPPLRLYRLDARTAPAGRIAPLRSARAPKALLDPQAVVVVGGTTNALLRLGERLPELRSRLLVVDEASMLMSAHLLALATVLETEGADEGLGGTLLVAGDNRQLAPIVAHDWEREQRESARSYAAHLSAFDAVAALAADPRLGPAAVRRCALSLSFRLPEELRRLLAPVYRRDAIELAGRAQASVVKANAGHEGLAQVWQAGGLYLLVHEERSSQRTNELEADLVRELVAAAPRHERGSIGVVTPHRAQRALIRERIGEQYGAAVDVVDTVERLQGGERPTVIVSACASDPSVISARAEFLLDMRRATVAFSRAKERLVVVCARTLLEALPEELELYEQAMLWKSLRRLACQTAHTFASGGVTVRLYRVPPPAGAPAGRPGA